MQPLEVGEEVLVFLPTKQNKLQLQWTDLYTRKITPVDYEVKRPGHTQENKIYHVNLLKKWHPSSSSHAKVTNAAEDVESNLEELETE